MIHSHHYDKKIIYLNQVLRQRVIAASAGSYAQGVALAAEKLKIKAIIVMPVTIPQVKIDAAKARGAEVVLQRDTYDDACAHAKKLCQDKGLTFIHPFDDPDVIAG